MRAQCIERREGRVGTKCDRENSLRCEMEGDLDKLTAWAVVDTTGKHRTPGGTQATNVARKFKSLRITHIHRTEMHNNATCLRAIETA